MKFYIQTNHYTDGWLTYNIYTKVKHKFLGIPYIVKLYVSKDLNGDFTMDDNAHKHEFCLKDHGISKIKEAYTEYSRRKNYKPSKIVKVTVEEIEIEL